MIDGSDEGSSGESIYLSTEEENVGTLEVNDECAHAKIPQHFDTPPS